jgi:hypothetical protein
MCYEETRGNGREALRIYQQRFPRRNHPHHAMIAQLHQCLRETGFLCSQHFGGGRHNVRTPEFEEAVLEKIANEPSTSTCAIGHAMGTSQSSVCRVLREQEGAGIRAGRLSTSCSVCPMVSATKYR